MFCSTLRASLAGRWILAGLVCVALVGGAAISPPIPRGESETSTIGLRAPALPLAALQTTLAVRLEKQAHSTRVGIYKPERSGRVALAEREHFTLQRPNVRPTFPLLARCFLPTRRLMSQASNESADPFLASSLLS